MIKNMFCWTVALIVVLASCEKNNGQLEEDHPYDPNVTSPSQPNDLLPGFSNLGGTCFANASINLLLSSSEFIKFLSSPLPNIAGDTPAQHDLRVKLQTTLKALYDVRSKKQKDLSAELNAYFDAFEAARKAVVGSELVGGQDRLRHAQSDADDFILDNFTLLGYSQKNVAFTYYRFNDASTKVSPDPSGAILKFYFNALAADKEHQFEDLYKEWIKPEARRVANNAGLQADANKFEVILEPAAQSLFFTIARFEYKAGKKIKHTTVFKPTLQLEIKSKTKADLNKDHPHTYHLKAVAVHHGSTEGGHYYAYVFNQQKKRWEKYNDSQASVVDVAEVTKDSSDNGYIFLYELNP